MKNAMKKIMGLLLVAVLLVSVVPFQALASEGHYGFPKIIFYDENGTNILEKSWTEGANGPDTKTARDMLNEFKPGWEADYTFTKAVFDSKEYGLDDTIRSNVEGTVEITLRTIPSYEFKVFYREDGTSNDLGYAVFTRKENTSLSWNDIAEKNPKADAYKISRVTTVDGNSSIENGGSVTVKNATDYIAYMKGIGAPTTPEKPEPEKVLTAQYYVDGVLRTENYDVDGKTVSELVSDSKLGNYNASKYDITAKVGNNTKGMNDVIYRGETVAITMNTKNTSGETKVLTAHYYVDGDYKGSEEFKVEHKKISELVEMGGFKADKYEKITASVDGTDKGTENVVVEAGQTVKIFMSTKSTSGDAKFLIAHYYIDGEIDKTKKFDVDSKKISELLDMADYDDSDYKKITSTVDGTDKGTDNVVVRRGQSVKIYMTTKSTNKFPYKVYLHVYLNNNIGEPDRNINITNTLAVDGVVSMSEVKNLIPEYYKAKNSNGIGYDGLYLAKGNWVKDYVTDSNKYEKLNDVDVRTGDEYVHINVMITNATAKTSSNADTSNPKTGDTIFMTITVMGLSAAALTGLYVYDKKRKAQ